MRWTADQIPSLEGRTFVVTGANTGLGFEATKELAAHGGRVIMACRNLEKAEQARARVRGDVEVRQLDLADLESVRAFAAGMDEEIDVLINNAGVMMTPPQKTTQGLEMQFGTNVVGPFLLTALLFARIRDRVVTESSLAHLMGRLDPEDPNWGHRRYNALGAYAQSKLGDLVFAIELQRRIAAAGLTKRSLAAHPGSSATELLTRPGRGVVGQFMRTVGTASRAVTQPAAQGALPTLFAATAPEAVGGSYIGPDGLGGLQGYPVAVNSSRRARDPEQGRTLWELCERLCGERFDVR